MSSRTNCTNGKAALGTTCFYCPAGSATVPHTDLTCYRCPYNKVAAFGSTTCTYCSLGYVPDTTYQNQCYNCPSGWYSNTTGATSCTLCGISTYSEPASTECQTCPQDMFCSIGTSYPISPSYIAQPFTIETNNLIGNPLPHKEGVKDELNLIITTIVLAVTFVVLLVVYNVIPNSVFSRFLERQLENFDLFFSLAHKVPENTPIKPQRTKLGGWCSILTVFVMIIAAVNILDNYLNYNLIRSISYFPKSISFSLSVPTLSGIFIY